MEDKIYEITYDQLVSFLETNPDWKYVNARNWERNRFYGIYRDGKMISTFTLEFKKNNGIKFRCLVTLEEYKHQGVITNAVRRVMQAYPNAKFSVDCNDFSVGIFRKLGYKEKAVHHYSMWNAYLMEYEYPRS